MSANDAIELIPCPFCGAEVSMTAGRPVSGTFPARSYTFARRVREPARGPRMGRRVESEGER